MPTSPPARSRAGSGREIHLLERRTGHHARPTNKESLIPSVTREEIEQLREDEVITGGMIPKVERPCTPGSRRGKSILSMAARHTPCCSRSSPARVSARKWSVKKQRLGRRATEPLMPHKRRRIAER
jgi:hypothetical protein